MIQIFINTLKVIIQARGRLTRKCYFIYIKNLTKQCYVIFLFSLYYNIFLLHIYLILIIK